MADDEGSKQKEAGISESLDCDISEPIRLRTNSGTRDNLYNGLSSYNKYFVLPCGIILYFILYFVQH